METKKVSIGIFVIGGLVLFALGMFVIGDRRQAFARHSEYYSEFANLAGLTSGAKVRVGGLDAGQVVSIGVPDSPSSGFRVKWKIDAKLSSLVRADSVVTIGTEGIVGGSFLSVRPGSAQAPQAAAHATIPGKEPTELSDLLERGADLLNDANGTLKSTGGKLNGALDGVTTAISNVNDVVVGLKEGRGTVGMLLTDAALADRIRQTVTTTTSDMQDIVADLKAGRGAAGMLLRNEAVAGQIREAIKNAQLATADLGHASQQADAMVSDLSSRQIPKKAGEVVDSLNDSARQVHQLIAEIAKPDQQGMSAGANIRQSLMNANTATSNLADATEALKHNFFVRGFFRKRGYYNLAGISPEEYRRERAFASPANHRVWLEGSALFQNDSNGVEELSANGKALLNASLTVNGDPAIASPIVVEGYWSGDVPENQLRFSRSRAMLVREYLHVRFQIDSRNLGIVALKDSPPKRTERSKWDGICIVVLSKS